MPNITFLQYKQIEALIQDNYDIDSGDYCGNKHNYKIEYIILSNLYKLLEKLKPTNQL